MPYIRPSGSRQCSVELVMALAFIMDLELPPEDVQPVADELSAQFAAAATLQPLTLESVHPLPDFDPRWDAVQTDAVGR